MGVIIINLLGGKTILKYHYVNVKPLNVLDISQSDKWSQSSPSKINSCDDLYPNITSTVYITVNTIIIVSTN